MTSHACPKKGYFFLKERLFLLVWPSLPLAQSISGVPESLAEGERWLVIRPGHLKMGGLLSLSVWNLHTGEVVILVGLNKLKRIDCRGSQP